MAAWAVGLYSAVTVRWDAVVSVNWSAVAVVIYEYFLGVDRASA